MKKLLALFMLLGLLASSSAVFAEEVAAPAPAVAVEAAAPAPAPEAAPAPKIDTGDTAWMMVSSALVLLMTFGLALFYGGMVRRKNVLSTMMQSFIAVAVVSVQWLIIGYSLAFGPDVGHIIGDLSWFGLNGVGFEPNTDYAGTIPHQVFMMFQLTFAIITPALITGAFAERFKFSTFLVFLVLWATLVYDPICHWVWAVNGWIRNMGALDFAGGTVVHISSGIAALAAAIVVGKRKNYLAEPMPPHNLTMTLLGAALLWFGWFGFNAGSAVASNGLAGSAFVVTHFATAAAALGWLFAEWIHRGKPTLLGAASGAVAGLVAITPASGFVTPVASLIIGAVAGVVCYMAVVAKGKFGYDDSLDAFGVHCIGGTWGALATGLFATVAVNSAGANGLFYGNPGLLLTQFKAVAVSWIYSFVVTFLLLKILDATMGLRVTKDEEEQGLDLTQHGENGYTM
ncbi:MAG: ammonium transporter [Nitrospinae bacterium]|nr:ammonium transporter [Nitrospinota bacterium]